MTASVRKDALMGLRELVKGQHGDEV
eukprot:COSAG01_NODE_62568_length_284_cov_0.421622_2_plen_25_part_01